MKNAALVVGLTWHSLVLFSQEFITKIKSYDEIWLDDAVERLGEHRVVFIAEVGHGDGTAIEIRNSLIKELIEQKGYNVLLFEGGIYDFNQSQNFIRKGADGIKVLEIVHTIESKVSTIDRKNFSFLTYHILNNEDFVLGGFDILMAGRFNFFETFLHSSGNTDKKTVRRYCELINFLIEAQTCWDCDFEDWLQSQFHYSKEEFLIEFSQLTQLLAQKMTGIEAQIIKSNHGLADWVLNRPVTLDEMRFYEIREKYLSKNLAWWLSEYPDRKIIVSGALNHLGRSRILGESAVQKLDENMIQDSYVLGIYGYNVETGISTKFQTLSSVHIAQEGTLEWNFHKTNGKAGFLDFTILNETQSSDLEPLVPSMRDESINWSQSVDGFYYVDKISPVTKYFTNMIELQKYIDAFIKSQ